MDPLPSPAKYTPWKKGVYEIAPGLKPFGTDFGNGRLDRVLFQFDSEFEKHRQNKLRCQEEDAGKYCLRHELRPEAESAAIRLIVDHLTSENPELFQMSGKSLNCSLTGESILPSLDALSMQIQEDIAIVQVTVGRDEIAYLNLCSPSHWSGASKIGRSFFETHIPIPHFERVNAVAPAMVESMIHRGPFVRFVWGVESDNRLNHHPSPPPGKDPAEWYGRQFEKGWCIRFERQVTWGMPEVNAALFVIRVGFVTSEEVLCQPELWNSLKSAIQSMSCESAFYKGVEGFKRLFSV